MDMCLYNIHVTLNNDQIYTFGFIKPFACGPENP